MRFRCKMGHRINIFFLEETVHEGAIAVLPSGVQSWGGYDDTDSLTTGAEGLDVVFVGTGAEVAHPPAAFTAATNVSKFPASIAVATISGFLELEHDPASADAPPRTTAFTSSA